MGCPRSIRIGESIVFGICTHDPDTGVLTDADALPTYRVYEEGTEAAIATGSMVKSDSDNTTGYYIKELECTSGNGYEDGKSYNIYIEAIVDGDKGGITYGFKAVLMPVADELFTVSEEDRVFIVREETRIFEVR